MIAAAGRSLFKARNADRVAGFSGLAILLSGLVTLPFALGSGLGMALGVVLIVIGWRELSLRKDIRSLDPRGFGRLARNQLVLAGVISGYGVSRLLGPVPVLEGLGGAELEGLGTNLEATAQRIATLTHYAVGAGIIVLTWVFQGGQALYYGLVGRSLRTELGRYPPWVMQVHSAAWSGRLPIPHPDAPAPPQDSDTGTPTVSESAILSDQPPTSGDIAA